MTITDLKRHFHKGKANAYAWPGGYPLFYVCEDGGALCPACVTKNRAQIFRSTHERARDGWALAGVDVNYEDGALYCDNCSQRIESAYAEDEQPTANCPDLDAFADPLLLSFVEVDVCIAGNPAVNGVCGDPDCHCASGAR